MHAYYVYTLNIIALVEHDSDGKENGQSTSTIHNQPQVSS